ncbi:2-oxoglutarate dehydrogenase complex dihydrolipoyllysine-residue succinyltransferase [Paenibacillus tarimensis]|uniref:2-oxoglutarate dehydrogenase complex dihydrolipoyllysine-residue succinyltransferase n=1 Tax=Paenibacillus tarimensis TaxID=416012 RepID=UPI001F42AF62|nr:2-oxoglutarate dehydrogenase complex dihydrolipoyllysine-residue succinyltransferase [Paenibacillus tarimensis]MCF2942633.1 2-oxoglutarate dehydrogenase complex dihydrolipoyllysine-residue succinyltransferase [Paenibacillus tarimensis]
MADIIIPELGESITEGTISRWLKKEGDSVQAGDLLVELETDKVNLEISAEADGVLGTQLKGEGDSVQVGEKIGTITATGGSGGNKAASEPKASEAAAASAAPPNHESAGSRNIQNAGPVENPTQVKASPAARKLAREKGIELDGIKGKDPLGRIFPDDVRGAGAAPAASQSQTSQPGEVKQQSAPAPSGTAPDSFGSKPVERQRMSRRRQTIANRLVEAQQTAAMLTTFNEVDMTAILDVRKRRKQTFLEKHDVGLGFMSFFTKAVVGALKAFPYLNAEIDGQDILVKKFYDIGIAVAAKEGLVVPVVRDADRLGFAEIERTIAGLADKARSNTLSLSELQGGTFTITNGGVFGSLLSTPILNTPQVGILGMHKIQLRPVAIDAERMENRPMMYIALSYDHRIVDGSEAVRFLVKVKELLEDPETLLLEG